MASTTTRFQKIEVVHAVTGVRTEVMVDLESEETMRDKFGTPLVTTWAAYGRPQEGCYTVGMYGSNFVDSEVCEFATRHRIGSLAGTPDDGGDIDNPVVRKDQEPTLFAAICEAWKD